MAGAGADVALLGRRAGPLREVATIVRDSGRRALDLTCDVTEAAAVHDAAERVVGVLGPIDIVVANAGVNGWGPLDEQTPEVVRSVLATNIEGMANVVRAVVPSMQERSTGKVIVIASDNGRRAEADGSAYVASKFGAVGYALSISQELRASGVGVHVVEPGCVDTDWYPAEEDAPRDKMLGPDDVALAVMFLATLPPEIVLEELMLLPRRLLLEPW